MKKILLALAIIGLIVPVMIAAQTAPDSCIIKQLPGLTNCGGACGTVGGTCLYSYTNLGTTGAMCCLFSTINYVVNWIFMIMMILVVILILVGAFMLITSAGDEEKVGKGRNYIVFAMIGVAVALLARALPYLIRSIMGVTG